MIRFYWHVLEIISKKKKDNKIDHTTLCGESERSIGELSHFYINNLKKIIYRAFKPLDRIIVHLYKN